MGLFRNSYELVREAYQVARPSMGLVTSSLYLYKNENPSLWMALYFAFIFQLGCNAGNDYMDWERDMAEPGREFSVSRGKARSKDFVWYYYAFASSVAVLIGIFDHFQGALYFVITEFAGQWMYNGMFLGFSVNKLSLVKSFGFPLDFVVACWTYMPYAHLAGQRSWLPTLTISAWGTTMLWAQMKDYEHEKNTKVKTTATTLGPNLCRIIISAAAVVMMYGDIGFFIYGFYTIYRCWYTVLTNKQPKGKMSVIMALNLMLITLVDGKVDFGVKWTCYLAQIFAFIIYRLSYTFEQKYYAIMAILNRSKSYSRSIWDEKDPEILLWKVGGLIGRYGIMMAGLFDIDMARLSLMAYIVFRTQLTWDGVTIDKADGVKGLGLLPKRHNKLETSDGLVDEDDVENVKWDLESHERNRLYVDITKNVHRFDPVYKRMKPLHRDILRKYAEDMNNGLSKLQLLQDAPVTPELMRKHAEVIIDTGFFGMCKIMSPELLKAIMTDKDEHTKVSEAYVCFSNYIWYLKLAASIDEDVAQGVVLDEELRAMGTAQNDVMNRVRTKWLVFAIRELLKSEAFLFHRELEKNRTLRLFVLQLFQTSMNVTEKYCLLLKDDKCKEEFGSFSTYMNFARNIVRSDYSASVSDALQSSESLLKGLEPNISN